ncbi:MAG: 16S rRNA (guanine(966)-N(2))-methyltransferase RsmD [Dehalococcoidia bacterium]|nr:16S rRNA (guanine(966)-N(2))-methyltransferase RsmD [Dehalococcoidia bacterium]
MRVIAGDARGVVLVQPPGAATRPTSARLREALFGMLEAAGADLGAVLDLYAGTGALGIEALSRGDGHCTFVDADARAADTIRTNLERTGLTVRGVVARAPVGRWRPPAGAAYALVLADPPYNDANAWAAIERTVAGALAPHAMLAVEHAARAPAPAQLAGLPLWRDRRHGDAAVAVYRAPAVGGAPAATNEANEKGPA